MDVTVILQIAIYSTLVFCGIGGAAWILVMLGHALAANAVEEDPHAH